ncbi:MAG: hypothetical protein ACYS5V_04690 [Planctomycetota bacterium]|jgi:hypothetical protein
MLSMILGQTKLAGDTHEKRRALAAVAMVAVLIILNLIVVGLVVGLGRDHSLTVHRMQTIEAMYAAEAGMNMSIREMMYDLDEDGDGAVGTISDDSDDGTDPDVGNARFVVTAATDTPAAGQTTITSAGRSGEARRTIDSILE